MGLEVGEVLFPDRGKALFNGQKSHQERGGMSAQQTEANVARTVPSEQVLQWLAVRVHV